MTKTISPNGSSKNTKNVEAPFLLRFWAGLVASLPTIKVFGLNVSLTIVTGLVLGSLRFVVENSLSFFLDWPENEMVTKDAAASIVAMFHSLNLVPALGACFLSHPYHPAEKMTVAPQWWQDGVHGLLQFCTGYMIYDGVLNILILKYNPDAGYSSTDIMFLGHHVATSLYMTSVRLTGAGHQSAMMCMFLGECTNPFHNGYYVALSAVSCCNGPLTQLALQVVEFCFAASYCFVRAIVGPPVLIHMTYTLWAKREASCPVWLVLIWNVLIWGVTLGSLPWIFDCWSMLKKYLPIQDSASAEL